MSSMPNEQHITDYNQPLVPVYLLGYKLLQNTSTFEMTPVLSLDTRTVFLEMGIQCNSVGHVQTL